MATKLNKEDMAQYILNLFGAGGNPGGSAILF